VIDDKVDDDADATLLAAVGELDEISECAVAGIDAVIVCLDDVQTRTSWLWHLYYAATERVPPVPFWGR
jgi:hypothetical protein